MSHASKDMTEGYLTLAVGRENYLRMCINLAISIKINDPKRRTCLAVGKSLLNEAILTEIDSVFDDRIEIEETNLEGVEYKMNSYNIVHIQERCLWTETFFSPRKTSMRSGTN